MVRNQTTAPPTIVTIRTPPAPASPAYPPPHGYRFNPTADELLGYFLFNHVQYRFPPEDLLPIRHRDIYPEEPWEAWQRSQIGGEPENDVYFFTELKKKQETNKRYERKVGKSGGSWHGEDVGTKFELIGGGEKLGVWAGMRKRFNYKNNNLPSENGKWILHEYSISKGGKFFSEVLCILKNNKSPSAKLISTAAVAGKTNGIVDHINDSADSHSLKRARLNPGSSSSLSNDHTLDPKGKSPQFAGPLYKGSMSESMASTSSAGGSNHHQPFDVSSAIDVSSMHKPITVENVYKASMSESMASTSNAGSHHHPQPFDVSWAIDVSNSAYESNNYYYHLETDHGDGIASLLLHPEEEDDKRFLDSALGNPDYLEYLLIMEWAKRK